MTSTAEEREEKSAIAIGSNEAFPSRTKTFANPASAPPSSTGSPLNGQIIETGTTSYRLAHARAARGGRATPAQIGNAWPT